MDTQGVDDAAIQEGLAWVVAVARASDCGEIGLFVPVLNQVEPLGRSLGKEAAGRLKRVRKYVIQGIQVRLFTDRTVPPAFTGPVLAVWVDDKRLQKLDSLGCLGLCAIPWVAGELSVWKRTWNPTELRSGVRKPESDIGTPVLIEAIKTISKRINLSSGLAHPSDKAFAVKTLRDLVKAREQFDPRDVQAIATRSGWRPEHAAELARLAARIQEGRHVRTKGRW